MIEFSPVCIIRHFTPLHFMFGPPVADIHPMLYFLNVAPLVIFDPLAAKSWRRASFRCVRDLFTIWLLHLSIYFCEKIRPETF